MFQRTAELQRPGVERARSTPRRSATRKARYDVLRRWRARQRPAIRGTRARRASGTRRPRSASASSRSATPSAASASTRPTATSSGSRGERRCCASSCAQDPRARARPRARRAALPLRPPARHQAACASTPATSRRSTATTSRLVSIRERPIDEITEHGLRIGDEQFALDTIVLRHRLRRDDRRAARDRPARPRRPVAAREVGGRPALVRSGSRSRASRTSSRHRPGQPVRAQQHDGLDRAARRLDRRLHRATCASTASPRSSRRAAAEDAWVEHVTARSATRASTRAPSRGTWARTSPASRASCCPTSAASAPTASTATTVAASGYEGFILSARARSSAR